MEIFGLSRAVTLDLTFTLGNKYADSLKVGEKLFSAWPVETGKSAIFVDPRKSSEWKISEINNQFKYVKKDDETSKSYYLVHE